MINQRQKNIPILIFLAGLLAMIWVMRITGNDLKQPATPHGIIDLEVAYNAELVNNVINAWQQVPAHSATLITVAKKNTWWDFSFIFFYSIFLWMLCKRIAGKHKWPIGTFAATCAIIAGVFDIGENIGMLLSLNGITSPATPIFTAICSGIKWLLLILIVLYILIAGLLVLFNGKGGRSIN